MLATNVDFPEKLQFLFEPAPFKVAYGGRGGGKTWGFARALLLQGWERPLRILCAREIQNSIHESVHETLKTQIAEIGLSGFYDVLQTEIRGKNGTTFTFAGLRHNVNSIKSKEGIDIVWVEEAQSVSKASWETLIPTIRKAGSEIWVTFNPALEKDNTYERFILNPPTGAVVVKIGWEDVEHWLSDRFHQDRLDLLARDPDAYQNVYGGFCKQFLDGSVYANELRKATAEGRICKVPYDAAKPVQTFWDLGHADATAIWFAQSVGFELRLIDYYANRGQALPHYLAELQKRSYVYGEDWLPHDAQSKTIGTGRSVEDLMRAAGRKVQITPKLSVEDGINAARTIFGRCYFDEQRCADGLQALRHYRYDTDDNGQFKKTPLHDWASDGADAFRYFAVAMKEPRKAKPAIYSRMGGGAQSWMGA